MLLKHFKGYTEVSLLVGLLVCLLANYVRQTWQVSSLMSMWCHKQCGGVSHILWQVSSLMSMWCHKQCGGVSHILWQVSSLMSMWCLGTCGDRLNACSWFTVGLGRYCSSRYTSDTEINQYVSTIGTLAIQKSTNIFRLLVH